MPRQRKPDFIPMCGIYDADQLTHIISALPSWAKVARTVILYARPPLHLTVYAKIADFIRSRKLKLRLIGGFEIDGIAPRTPRWLQLYSPVRWQRIIEDARIVAGHTGGKDVFLVYEPATDDYYGGIQMTPATKRTPPMDWYGLTRCHEMVASSDFRPWYDLPIFDGPRSYDPAFVQTCRRWIHAIALQQPWLFRKAQWAVGYTGWSPPTPETIADRDLHASLVGVKNLHERLFVSHSGLYAASNDRPCFSPRTAIDYTLTLSRSTVWYITHADWLTCAQDTVELLS